MRLSKKMVSLICLSFLLMISISSSASSIEDNSNLSSIVNIDESVNAVIKSEEDKTIEGEVEKTSSNMENEAKPQAYYEEVKVDNSSTEDALEKIETTDQKDVIYLRNDMTEISGITKEDLEKVLLTYNGASTMAHLSQALVDAEKEYGVNAFAMAGIVALESGFATSRRAVEDNNLTGYEVYADDSEGRLFSSQYESIMQTAKHLSNNYLKEDGVYYKGLSVDAVQMSYCPDKSNNWHNKVDMLASGFFRVYKEIKK